MLICLQRIPTSEIPFFSVDEAVSAVVAQEIVEGGLPYRDAIDHRGPLTYYFYALIFEAAGDWNMAAVHVAYALLLCLIAAILFFTDKQIGPWAALFFAVFSWTHPPLDFWAAHTEWLMICGTSLGMMILLRSQQHLGLMFFAGLCVGIAALSKQVAVWELAGIGLWILWSNWKLPLPWPRLLKQGGIVLLAFFFPILCLAIYFSQHGAWEDFLFYVWEYNVDYYLPEVSFLERISSSLALVFSFFGGALLLAFFCLRAGIDAWMRRRELSQHEQLLICWFVASLLGALTSGRNFGHYAIQWLPAASLLAAWGWEKVWMNSKTHEGKERSVFLIGILILGLVIPIGDTLVKNKVYLQSAFGQQPVPASYIQSHTEPHERIFVWGFAPGFYLHAERRPATRFVYCNVLTGLIPWENLDKVSTAYAEVPGAWDQLMQDLEKHTPSYVLDTSPVDFNSYSKYPIQQYPQLANWLNQHYERDSAFILQYPSSPYHLYKRIQNP